MPDANLALNSDEVLTKAASALGTLVPSATGFVETGSGDSLDYAGTLNLATTEAATPWPQRIPSRS